MNSNPAGYYTLSIADNFGCKASLIPDGAETLRSLEPRPMTTNMSDLPSWAPYFTMM